MPFVYGLGPEAHMLLSDMVQDSSLESYAAPNLMLSPCHVSKHLQPTTDSLPLPSDRELNLDLGSNKRKIVPLPVNVS